MPNQKISELTAIVTVDNSVDVLPIVDISANTTKKVTPNALKTALALDNVNNTSDANKPVSIAQQDALNAKVDENAPITPGTAPKITFDAKGLVTSGDSLDETDLPTGINANKIGTGVVSTTEFEYLNGVTSAIQTQLNAKQATLVSGTNIKTINSTSLLGSGDIAISANPSGVSGAIQFSNGSAFASDAANLFWDDTNNRLGVGNNVPTNLVDIKTATGGAVANYALVWRENTQNRRLGYLGADNVGFYSGALYLYQNDIDNTKISANGSSYFMGGSVGIGTSSPSARTHIVGSGSTSATTSLLVQNSAGNSAFAIKDDRTIDTFANTIGNQAWGQTIVGLGASGEMRLQSGGGAGFFMTFHTSGAEAMRIDAQRNVGINTLAANNTSAILQVDSTTKGVLFPRMTTTQKNAIASPAAGLVVYDSTTNKLQCYNGSTWNDLF